MCSVNGFEISRQVDFAEVDSDGRLVLSDTYTQREDDGVWIRALIGDYWTEEVQVATVTVEQPPDAIVVDNAPMFETELEPYEFVVQSPNQTFDVPLPTILDEDSDTVEITFISGFDDALMTFTD